jgi:hypothetical protein
LRVTAGAATPNRPDAIKAGAATKPFKTIRLVSFIIPPKATSTLGAINSFGNDSDEPRFLYAVLKASQRPLFISTYNCFAC